MFRINSRCISCGTCWQFDPEHFANGGDAAVVSQQPRDLPALHQALLALQACPVAAIEASADQRREQPVDGFPVGVTHHASDEVLYCGWASKRSFGACSWLIRRPEGNVMVDVPRWSAPLARRIAAGLRLIPTPGHTSGSMCVQLGEQRSVLFSGDHLWWNRKQEVVVASARYCWWDFGRQIQSVRALLDLDVAWLLPGHGHRHAFALGEWRAALEQTLAWVER